MNARADTYPIGNYTMAGRSRNADFGIRSQDTALPNPVPHRHEYFQIHVNLTGSTRHLLGGVVRPIEPGTISFVQPYLVHFIPTVSGSRYFLINADTRFLYPGTGLDPLDLDARAALQAPELAPFQVQEMLDFRMDGDDLGEIERLCNDMVREDAARGFASTTLIRAALLRLIGLAGNRHGGAIRALAGNDGPRVARRRTLSSLVKYLRSHIDQPVSLQDAAAAVYLSPTHLAHVIKNETGRTFLDLLTERRKIKQEIRKIEPWAATDLVERWPSMHASLADGSRFPVRRIYCVGRNYVEHIREMKEGDERDPPFFFQKPGDALVPDQGTVPYPSCTDDLQYEVEMVVAIGRHGRDVAPGRALDLVFGYAVGLDMTRRDRQREAGRKGLPWEIGKSFDHSAPCGAIDAAERIGHPREASIRLLVNGERRQESNISLMIWKVSEIVVNLSKQYALAPGDLIYTGTPAGVGPVRAGDWLEAHVDGLPSLTIHIGPHET